MATAKKRAPSKPNLMNTVKGGKSDTRDKIASSLGRPKAVVTTSAALNNAAKQVMQAFKLEAVKPEENGSTSLRVTLNIHNLGIGKRQLPELLTLVNEELKAQTGSLAKRTVREEHVAGSDNITFIANVSTGDHTVQDLDRDRFHPRPTKLR